jgi:hypothetical protein
MKKVLLSSVIIFCYLSHYGQIPVTLTFQAKDSLTQNALALDSVNVKNLTENCDTTLYDSVSVLTLNATWPVGIGDPSASGSESLILMQNGSNPFQGSTTVRVFLKKDGALNLALYNNQGRKLSEYQNVFEEGWRLFTVSAGASQLMFLRVTDNLTAKTVKLISTGTGNEGNRISYIGSSDQGSMIVKSSPKESGFVFYLGNQLMYTAYTDGYKENLLFDNPVSSETYTFEMATPVFTCGSTLTINHVAGTVAPVDKTVTYGTVTNIPGETSKCWITSNLGSDHQATAKDDATEPSAGWYWQFNRKQGYKHTGTVRTPNTTWITNISENSDWIPANDPCAIELGAGWRLPTATEWINVYTSGNWTNWNGPWDSGLKLHAAGQLLPASGSLNLRGVHGRYRSSTQDTSNWGENLIFGSGFCKMWGDEKAYGNTARCIKE